MGLRFSQIGDEILADQNGSENQVISDIQVKSFLTRGWGDERGVGLSSVLRSGCGHGDEAERGMG
jgi:hypothetical protein